MSDRFDLEQEILQCWSVTSDIHLLFESVMEREMNQDQIANVLLGIKELYELKFNKCFNTFERLVEMGKVK